MFKEKPAKEYIIEEGEGNQLFGEIKEEIFWQTCKHFGDFWAEVWAKFRL